MLTPALSVTFLIIFFPIVQIAVMSLFNYVIWKPKDTRFIGLGNYLRALQEEICS